MSLAPTYEAIKREISKKTTLRKKPYWFLDTGQECKDGLLPSIKRNSFWEVGDVNYQDNKGVPLCYVFVWSILLCYGSATTVWFLLVILLFLQTVNSSSVCVDIIFTLWNISIFRCEPWLFIRMIWDSPWNLIVLVADGTIMCDAYSTPTFDQWYVKYQSQSVLPVLLCLPASFWKGWAVTEPVSLTIAVASSGEAVSIGTLLTNSYRQLICGCCMFRA